MVSILIHPELIVYKCFTVDSALLGSKFEYYKKFSKVFHLEDCETGVYK